MISFFVGLIIGAIGVVAVEAAAVLYFIYKLNQKTKKVASFSPSPSSLDSSEVLDPQQSLEFAYKKQVLDLVLVYTCMLNFLIGRSYCVYDSFELILLGKLIEFFRNFSAFYLFIVLSDIVLQILIQILCVQTDAT